MDMGDAVVYGDLLDPDGFQIVVVMGGSGVDGEDTYVGT